MIFAIEMLPQIYLDGFCPFGALDVFGSRFLWSILCLRWMARGVSLPFDVFDMILDSSF